MERPFDYPGRHSDIVTPDPYQLRRKDARMVHEYDACGGVIVRVFICFAPDWWSDEDVASVIAQRFEAEHCHHSYDCCGQYYAGPAKVLEIIDGVEDDEGDKARMVIVRQTYTQNV